MHLQTEETAWRVSFEVEASSKSTTEIVVNSVRILNGVFRSMREFLDARQPERLILSPEHESFGERYEEWSMK